MTEWSTAQTDARRTLMQWVFGARATEVVSVATRMDLADTIGDGEADVTELARGYEIPPEQLNRLLRALASLGLCTEPRPGIFALTEAGSLLRKGHPASLHDFAGFHTAPVSLAPWSRLESNIRTGRTAFDEHFGMPIYEYLGNEPELSAVFNTAMSQETHRTAATLTEHYDFGRFTTVTDIGGGDGTLLASILKGRPGLSGVVFDTAEGAGQAAGTIKAAGLEKRCTVATGNFLEAIPAGADLYMIKSVIHNWDDDRAATILRNCRTAMSAGSRLLIVDVVLPETVIPDSSELNPYLKDLQMMVLVGGKERTRADFEKLCTRAGLTLTDIVTLPSHVGLSLIEAVPS
ncbi:MULTISPECIES: methyltransferase [Streptomyces]|uniref:methyltransferase n=1 Tax=Streptomyces TaxID=1883 RepID=UPI000B9E09D2|nr:methyltransferase [Streptomyces kasugaensis]